jgi:hypothetical protein
VQIKCKDVGSGRAEDDGPEVYVEVGGLSQAGVEVYIILRTALLNPVGLHCQTSVSGCQISRHCKNTIIRLHVSYPLITF